MAALVSGRHVWEIDVPRSTRKWSVFGWFFIGITIVSFGTWANMALIAGAVVTTGVFVTTGQNKVIQHLEGGVIRDILVREGDVVQPNQVVMELEDTVPKAELRRLTLREARLSAIEARLTAEAAGAAEIKFPQSLLRSANDPDISALLNDQRLSFTARRNNLNSELAVLEDGIDAFNQRIEGSKIQKQSVQRQLELFAKEVASKRSLLAVNLIRESEVLALERAYANGQGEIGRLEGDIGTTRGQINRIQEQMTAARNAAIKSAVEELHATRADLNDVRERIRSANDLLTRTKIRSPVHGVIVKLRYHASGEVVEASKEIMQIVPVQDELLIEARIRPQDIEHVKEGQFAEVRLTALNQRSTPMVGANVSYVSADAFPDERRGIPITTDLYVVRVRLDPKDVAKLPAFAPVPGMPAEVFIKTGERTFFEYLTRPIRDSMARAFREP